MGLSVLVGGRGGGGEADSWSAEVLGDSPPGDSVLVLLSLLLQGGAVQGRERRRRRKTREGRVHEVGGEGLFMGCCLELGLIYGCGYGPIDRLIFSFLL